MKYKIQPEKWQCPDCLANIGIIGNWINKIAGKPLQHQCDKSNVDNKMNLIPRLDWSHVIDHYIQLVNQERARRDSETAKRPFTLELKVAPYRRGLALDKPDEWFYFLDHIVRASIEIKILNSLIEALERRKNTTYYGNSDAPECFGVKLDPNCTEFPAAWRDFIYPTFTLLSFHLVNGETVEYSIPYHLKDKALEAANKLLQTGETQIIEYVPRLARDGTRDDIE